MLNNNNLLEHNLKNKEEEFNNQLRMKDDTINKYLNDIENFKLRLDELEIQNKTLNDNINDIIKINHNLEEEIKRLKSDLKKTEENYNRLGIDLENKYKEKNVI
jgi:hypothetical protein